MPTEVGPAPDDIEELKPLYRMLVIRLVKLYISDYSD